MLGLTVVVAEAALPTGKPVGTQLVVNPTDRWSANVPLGVIGAGTFTIFNIDAQQPLKPKVVNEQSGDKFKATLNALEEGKRYSLSFTSSEGLAVGVYKHTIRIETGLTATPVLEIPLELQIIQPVTLNPLQMRFENVPVSTPDYDVTTLSKFTWVRYNRGQGLELTKLSSDLPFITVKVESIEGNKEVYLLRVGFSAKPKPGRHQGTLRIETNHQTVPVLEMPITVIAQ